MKNRKGRDASYYSRHREEILKRSKEKYKKENPERIHPRKGTSDIIIVKKSDVDRMLDKMEQDRFKWNACF